MTEQDQISWNAERGSRQAGHRPVAGRRGWMARVLGVSAGRSLSTAVLVGALGSAAFVASMSYRWESVVVNLTQPSTDMSNAIANGPAANANTLSYDIAPTSVDGLGTVYVLTMIGLIAVIGAAVGWSHLAARLRVVATGVGVGLVGVLVALTLRLDGPDGLQPSLGQAIPIELRSQLTISRELGQYFAYAAVFLCVAAVWLAGPSVRRSTAPAAAPAPAAPVEHADRVEPSTSDSWSAPTFSYDHGSVTGLTVSAAESVDIHPGDAWSR
jgi:hypothetical protein